MVLKWIKLLFCIYWGKSHHFLLPISQCHALYWFINGQNIKSMLHAWTMSFIIIRSHLHILFSDFANILLKILASTSTRFAVTAQSCPSFCDPWTAAHQTSLSFTISRSLRKLMFIESVMPSNHLILLPLFPPQDIGP